LHADLTKMTAVVAGREPDGWTETDDGEVRMVMAALRQVVDEALHQNITTDQIFAEVGAASARRSQMLSKLDKELAKVERAYRMRFGHHQKSDMLRHSRRMSGVKKIRYHLFLGGSLSL
jgi:hypothetical protein